MSQTDIPEFHYRIDHVQLQCWHNVLKIYSVTALINLTKLFNSSCSEGNFGRNQLLDGSISPSLTKTPVTTAPRVTIMNFWPKSDLSQFPSLHFHSCTPAGRSWWWWPGLSFAAQGKLSWDKRLLITVFHFTTMCVLSGVKNRLLKVWRFNE